MTDVVALRPQRICSPDALEQQLDDLYHRGGLPRGDLTGWPSLDELYSVGGGQWSLITGVPGMGKSELLDALTVNLAERGDWVFGVFSPENYPTAVHAARLIEKRTRKPFGKGPTERLSVEELKFATRWVTAHYTWIDQHEHAPLELVTTALAYARRPGRKLGIVIDPWNQLDHHDPAWRKPSMTETEYVSATLSGITTLLRSPENADVHLWIVAHPAKLYRGHDGKFPLPTGYDISGSAHWFNKADAILCVDRDKHADTQEVDVHVQKVRFKHIGHVGTATLKYDRVTGRYFEFGAPTLYNPITGKPERYGDPESAGERAALQSE